VNNIFLLHDSFVGTSLAKRMVSRCKGLLHYITKRSKNKSSYHQHRGSKWGSRRRNLRITKHVLP